MVWCKVAPFPFTSSVTNHICSLHIFLLVQQKRQVKAKKDPNAPKRGQSAYMLWLNDNRKSIAKAGMSVTDVAKAAGERWRGMSAGDKSVRNYIR